MKTTFYLIRHGQSLGNIQHRFLGHTDWDLTELGYRQAECTAAVFEDIPVDVIVASDLKRAWNTAVPVAKLKNLPIRPEPGFREIFAGDWEGRIFEEIQEIYPEAYTCWREDIGHAKTPEGETVLQLYDRVSDTLRRTAETYADKTIVVATHATPIRLLVTALSGRPVEEAAKTPWVSNASVTKLILEDGTYRIEYADRHDHLGVLSTTLPANV